MEDNKVDMYLAMNANKFPAERIMQIKELLLEIDDDKYYIVQSIPLKDTTTLMIVSVIAGAYGVDRFMLGDVGLGVAKLLTCGGMGIWAIIDIFTVTSRTKEYNYIKFMQAIKGPGYYYEGTL